MSTEALTRDIGKLKGKVEELSQSVQRMEADSKKGFLSRIEGRLALLAVALGLWKTALDIRDIYFVNPRTQIVAGDQLSIEYTSPDVVRFTIRFSIQNDGKGSDLVRGSKAWIESVVPPGNAKQRTLLEFSANDFEFRQPGRDSWADAEFTIDKESARRVICTLEERIVGIDQLLTDSDQLLKIKLDDKRGPRSEIYTFRIFGPKVLWHRISAPSSTHREEIPVALLKSGPK